MKKRIRKGISAIIFTKISGKKKYLLLKRKMYWTGWEWLKGGRKKHEGELKCLYREIKEETNKNPDEYGIKKTKYLFSFMYNKPFVHDFQLWDGAINRIYLVEFYNSKIKLDNDEHSSYKWTARKEALKKITWSDQRKVFNTLTK